MMAETTWIFTVIFISIFAFLVVFAVMWLTSHHS